MINAGTVGAYLTLNITDFRDNLDYAGKLLRGFRSEYDDGFVPSDAASAALLGGLTVPLLAAGKAAADFALQFRSAFQSVGSSARDTSAVIAGVGPVISAMTKSCRDSGIALDEFASRQADRQQQAFRSVRLTIDSVCAALNGLPRETRSAALASCQGMINSLADSRSALFAAAKSAADSVLGAVNRTLGASSASGGMNAAGKRAVISLGNGIVSQRSSALSAVGGIMRAMLQSASSVSFSGIGSNIVSGIVRGINQKKSGLISAAAALAASAAAAAKRALGIRSPSRVMMEVGRFAAEGMELGIRQGSRSLYQTASAVSDETAAALGGISAPGLRFSSALSSGSGDRLDRLLAAVEKLAASSATMEIDGRPFGRLVRDYV